MTQRSMCVVIHDVAPQTWPRCQSIIDCLVRIGDFPVTLLAVPRHHGVPRNAAFEAWLVDRANRGDEVALHGYTHLDDGRPRGVVDRLRRQVYTRGEGEFWDLPRAEAERRLDAGSRWLGTLGIAPAGFIAPAWLMGPATWQALRSRAFDYTCTLKRIHLLPQHGPSGGIDCQAQVYSSSSAWRRWMSVAWNASLARVQSHHALVRLELHPGDVQAPVHRAWQRLALEQARKRQVITLQTAAGKLRDQAFQTHAQLEDQGPEFRTEQASK